MWDDEFKATMYLIHAAVGSWMIDRPGSTSQMWSLSAEIDAIPTSSISKFHILLVAQTKCIDEYNLYHRIFHESEAKLRDTKKLEMTLTAEEFKVWKEEKQNYLKEQKQSRKFITEAFQIVRSMMKQLKLKNRTSGRKEIQGADSDTKEPLETFGNYCLRMDSSTADQGLDSDTEEPLETFGDYCLRMDSQKD